MLKTMTKPEAETAMSDFDAAEARWKEVRDKDRELTERHEAMRLALSLTFDGSGKRAPEHLREKAKPFLKLAAKRRGKLTDQIADVEDEIDDFKPKLMVENELWQAARRRETNRLAGDLQPRHKVAVKSIATALEALSIAIEEETTTRAALARVAPEPESALLPNCSHDLLVGTLTDWNSPASAWARRMRKLQILG